MDEAHRDNRRWFRGRGELLAFLATLLCGCALGFQPHSPDDVVAGRQRMLRGIDAWQRQDFAHAEENFRAAVDAAPQDERAHFQYARSLWQRGARAEAMSQMAESVRLSGGNRELLVEMGRMQLAEDRLDAAQASAEQAIASDRQFAPAHALLGDVLAQRRRLDQAMESYHLSLALEPRNPKVQLAVANIYRTWGEPRRSLSTLQAIDLTDAAPELLASTYHLQGVAQRELGRYEDSVNQLRHAIAVAPTATMWCDLAEAQLAQGDAEAARRSMQSALALDADREIIGPQIAALEGRMLR